MMIRFASAAVFEAYVLIYTFVTAVVRNNKVNIRI